MRNKKFSKNQPKKFWNQEYAQAEYLALSARPSENLIKFTRWLEREYGKGWLNKWTTVLDLGCGNGRHLIYLNQTFGCRGYGYDISEEAIKQAINHAGSSANGPNLGRSASGNPKLKPLATSLNFEVRSLTEALPLADQSVDLALDMMSSHVLRQTERERLRDEVLRVLKPRGYLLFKTFLAEGDIHTKRLLREHPAGEPGSYIHPELGVYEHVWTIDEIKDFFGPYFEVRKIEKSHKHILHGRAHKRRYVVVYLEKKDD